MAQTRDPRNPPFSFFEPNQPRWPAQPPSQQAMKPPASPGEKGKKQITRNRTSYSCKTCRKRKIKCDKVHPACGNCFKNQDYCEWSIDSRGSSTLPESSPEITRNIKRRKTDATDRDESPEEPTPESNGSAPKETAPISGGIEDRLDRLTQLVESLSRGRHDEAHAQLEEFGLRKEDVARRAPLPTSNVKDNDSPRPVTMQNSRGVSPSNPERSVSPNYPFDVPTASGELEDPLSKLNLGYLSVQEGGRSRYVGSTWFAFISDELDQLNVLLKDQNRYLSPSHIGNRACRDHDDRSSSPVSEVSDGQNHQSFHKEGDQHHHTKAQFRADCEACNVAATDKFMLFQGLDAHPSRFIRMNADMISGIPSEANSNVLFRCWMSGVHCYVPLLHPPAVLKKYNEFWAWYKAGRLSGEPLPEPSFLCVLYTIWYAGSVSISLKGLRRWFPDKTRAALSAGFHDQATKCLTLTNFPRNPSIYSLAALLMLQVIPAKEEEPLTISLFVSLALRVAQTMGLHREPSLFNITPFKAETRRRIFWQIFQLDTFVSITSGLPPMMNDEYFDTRPISELKDMLSGTEDGEAYETDVAAGRRPPDDPDNPTTRKWTSHVSVGYLVARARYDAAHAVNKILKIHLGTKRITRDDMLLMRKILGNVDRDINATIRRIPTKGIPELGFEPDKDEQGHYIVDDYDARHAHPPTEAEIRPFVGMTPIEGLDDHTVRYHWNTLIAFHKFSRIVLSLLVDKMYIVSFLPLLKNAKSKFWACARQCALRSCHGYMRKFIALAKDPAFQPFQWSWPGMHQPMHATMIMLVDLYERPTSVEAPRSRAFIDQVFAMSGPDGGIVSGEDGVTVQRPLREGGREAWDLLRKLREKAWQKAGLDPDVLWTVETQIQAGIAQPLTEVQRMAQSLREDVLHDPIDFKNPDDLHPLTSSAAGVQNLVNSAVNDMRNATKSSAQKQEYKPPASANLETTDQFRPTTSFPPLRSLPSQPSMPGPTSQSTSSYFTAAPAPAPAPSILASPNDPSVTRTTPTSQDNAATADSLRLDIHGATPLDGTAPPLNGFHVPPAQAPHINGSAPPATSLRPPPPPHEEHYDEDFWTRWDSVLGSHGGYTFEDAMEDIVWDNLGGTGFEDGRVS